MWEVNIYIQQDNTDCKSAIRNYIYVMECVRKSGQPHRTGDFGTNDGTYHQTSLVAVNTALERINQSCAVNIYIGDTFVSNMFHNRLGEWAGNDWRTSRGEKIANQKEWENLWKLTRGQLVRMIPGKHPYSEILVHKMQGGKEECMKYLETLTVQRR